MHIHSLRTENFKKLGDFSCTFTEGLNVIAGDNAQGKSTLLQALQVAFYGPSVVPGNVSNIPTWGSKNFKVEVQASLKGDRYTVVRSKSTASLKRNDELVANGSTPVTAYMTELLGMDAKDYDLFWQSKQGASAGMLVFGATALNRKVEEFAGVDVIDRVQDRAQKKATAAKTRAETLAVDQETLKGLEASLLEEAAILKDAAADSLAAHAAQEAQPAKPEPLAGETSGALLRRQMEASQLLSKLEAAEQSRDRTAEVLEGYKADRNKRSYVDPAQLQQKIDASQAEGTRLAGIHSAAVAHSDSVYAAEARMTQIRKVRDDAKAELDKAAEGVLDDLQFAELTDGLDGLRNVLTDARDGLSQSRALLKQQEALAAGATCPTCGQAKVVHDPTKLVAELEQARAAVEQGESLVADAQRKVDEISVQWDSAAAARRSQDAIARRLSEADATLQQAGTALAELVVDGAPAGAAELKEMADAVEAERGVYADLKAQMKQLSQANAEYKAACDLVEAWDTKLTTESAAVALLDEQYGALDEPPTDEEVAARSAEEKAHADSVTAWTAEYNRLAGAVKDAEHAAQIARRDYDAVKKAVDDAFDKNRQAQADVDAAAKYDRLVKLLRDRRQAYLQSVWAKVLGAASRLVAEASSGLITGVDNREGEFWFEEAGTWAPVTSASGAQRSFLGVNLRIALTRTLYGADSPMMFDEPTEACSERNASGMAATIASAAKQVLLITHRERDQVLAQNVISVGE